MSDLERYRERRDFDATPEPEPGIDPGVSQRRFVVQRHDASSLHFDLRIEHEGVLLSWAVPKGVPLRGGLRRLAVETEPHPLEHLTFVGEIPEGQYGAGRMTIWDAGTYDVVGRAPGGWKLVFSGAVLRGEYHLVRTGDDDSNQWLIFRASTAGPGIEDPLERFRALRPMLPTLVDEPFDDPEWSFEIKWDGYRALALIGADGLQLRSRSGRDIGNDFNLGDLRRGVYVQEAILDGELVIFDEQGRADFGALQRRAGPVNFVAFDVLYADGVWLLGEAWAVRRELLARMLTPEAAPAIRLSDDIPRRGSELFAAASAQGVEGVVAKRRDAHYRPGERSDTWRKIKARRAGRYVIVGFLRGEGSLRDSIASVVVAERDGGGLVARGRVGSGISAERADELERVLVPRPEAEPPPVEFADAGVVWVEPEQECRISYLEVTEEGRLRAPVYGGLEQADPSGVGDRVVADGERRVALTNTSRPYWPAEGISKGDLIDHYIRVSEALIPHLRGRAMVLKRYPDGIEAEPFFQHSVPDGAPDWLRTADLARGDDPERATNRYVVVDDPLALFWVANLGCIDLNPWQSTTEAPDQPTYVLFDLDPMSGVAFDRVVAVAHLIREQLERLDLRGYPKTSGGSGMHVFVPIDRGPDYRVARLFAATLAERLAHEYPDLVTTRFARAERGERVYIDTNQIGRGRSISSVYSVRPRPGAPVSTPLEWSEVTATLDPRLFSMAGVAARISEYGDLFAPVLAGGQNLAVAAQRLAESTEASSGPE